MHRHDLISLAVETAWYAISKMRETAQRAVSTVDISFALIFPSYFFFPHFLGGAARFFARISAA